VFRKEALTQRRDRLMGDVSVAVPIAWQAIGYLLLAGVLIALLFFSLASYARVVPVSGVIAPEAGVAAVIPTRPGIVSQIHVQEGALVTANTILVSVLAEESANGVKPAAERIEEALDRQTAGLRAQSAASSALLRAQQEEVDAQRQGLAAEIDQLQSQIGFQAQLVRSAKDDLDRARGVAKRGFISGHDLRTREETLLERQQAVAQLTQTMDNKRAAFLETELGHARLSAQMRIQEASLEASRAQVDQALASNEGSRGYALRAPISGKVTAVLARLGQPTSAQTPLMSIVPKAAVLRAELAVPSTAIGFVKRGQLVRLAIDAFPYQRFGTISGKIVSVASSPVSQPTSGGQVTLMYPVVVTLERDVLTAYGRLERLVPGMTLTARIVTEQQSLLEWLFDPLFAVRGR
jgi:membrane fusion protein